MVENKYKFALFGGEENESNKKLILYKFTNKEEDWDRTKMIVGG